MRTISLRDGLTALAALVLFAPSAGAQTEIRESIKVGAGGCTITIVGGPQTVCAGTTGSVSATLDCGAGFAALREPEWSLDGAPFATGFTVAIPPQSEGSYLLTASCGSCSDNDTLTVLPISSCAYEAQLSVLYSSDATENTTGVFIAPNVAAVLPGNFNQLKFNMRPVTVDATIPRLGGAAAGAGGVILSSTGGNLQLFRTDGTAVTNPDTVSLGELPLTLYINATGTGDSRLIADYSAAATVNDTVRVRAGQFPGLGGESLSLYPFFQFMRSVNDSSQMKAALDPTRHAERTGLAYRAYVVAHKTPAQWAASNTLTDVTGGFENATVTAGSIASNTTTVWSPPLDGGAAGTVGKGYDIVLDFGANGMLDPGDIIDGLDYNQAGIYAVRNLTLAGNHAVTETIYSGGTWLGEDLYYPTDVASLGQLPLVVISHGNGHDYQWYDYLGQHLASYGYIVMSHQNNTGPGIPTASTTTLTNTDYLLGNLATIAGGALNGHVDDHKITWVGHSRGGEGVAYAYDRIFDGTYTPIEYTPTDIILIRSMGPTVFFAPAAATGPDPHDRNFELICGSADSDVSQDPSCTVCESQRILEHAGGTFTWFQVQGAGHGNFHSCFACNPWASGPDLIGYTATNNISKVILLAELEWFTRGNPAAKDYLTHLWDDHRSTGLITPASVPPGIVAITYKDAAATGTVILDDYQTAAATGTSSSGGTVTFDVSNLSEGNLNGDGNFTFTAGDPFNGCENMEGGDPAQAGVVFDWTTGDQKFYEQGIVVGLRNFTAKTFLSLRAAQGTRHPETVALNGPLYFTVELRDGAGHTSAINTQAYGGINRPYQRTGAGAGTGWMNEWNTVRIRLADFENNNSGIVLSDIVAVRLKFGSASGSARGRLVVDQVELTNE